MRVSFIHLTALAAVMQGLVIADSQIRIDGAKGPQLPDPIPEEMAKPPGNLKDKSAAQIREMYNPQKPAKIILASTSAAKIGALSEAFKTFGEVTSVKKGEKPAKGHKGIQAVKIDDTPGVPQQPTGVKETVKGAEGRIEQAVEVAPWADLYVTIENGIMQLGEGWYDVPVIGMRFGAKGKTIINFGSFTPTDKFKGPAGDKKAVSEYEKGWLKGSKQGIEGNNGYWVARKDTIVTALLSTYYSSCVMKTGPCAKGSSEGESEKSDGSKSGKTGKSSRSKIYGERSAEDYWG